MGSGLRCSGEKEALDNKLDAILLDLKLSNISSILLLLKILHDFCEDIFISG